VQQAVGTPRGNAAALPWLAATVEHARASGLVATLIARHAIDGLDIVSSENEKNLRIPGSIHS
ncbi:MAG: hypothetical protein AAFR52_10710, partial [Pseudomonadota bacterium]